MGIARMVVLARFSDPAFGFLLLRRLPCFHGGRRELGMGGGVPSGVGYVYGELVGAMTSSALRAPSPGRRRECMMRFCEKCFFRE